MADDGSVDSRTRALWCVDQRHGQFEIPGVGRLAFDTAGHHSDSSLNHSLTPLQNYGPLAAHHFARGLLALPGAAVVKDAASTVIFGSRGAGCSSIAAALIADGAAFVSDGTVAVGVENSNVSVEVGEPELHLWEDSATRLGFDPAELKRVAAGVNKFIVPAMPVLDVRVRVRSMVAICAADVPEPVVDELVRADRAGALLAAIAHRGVAIAANPTLMSLIGTVSSSVRVLRVRRPLSGSSPTALAELIESHLGAG